MKNKVYAIFILLALSLVTFMTSQSVMADDVKVESSQETKEEETTTEEDLYSSPSNDPNLQSLENEGQLRGHEYSPVDTDIRQIYDYSRTSERYPSTSAED